MKIKLETNLSINSIIYRHFLIPKKKYKSSFSHFLAPVSLSPCPKSPYFAIFISCYESCLTYVVEMLISPNYLTSSYLLAAPPAFIMASSILQRYCCCGPRMDPGLAIRIQPVKSAGGKPVCFIMYKAMREPVLPRPALQCTAIAPFSCSAACKN